MAARMSSIELKSDFAMWRRRRESTRPVARPQKATGIRHTMTVWKPQVDMLIWHRSTCVVYVGGRVAEASEVLDRLGIRMRCWWMDQADEGQQKKHLCPIEMRGGFRT